MTLIKMDTRLKTKAIIYDLTRQPHTVQIGKKNISRDGASFIDGEMEYLLDPNMAVITTQTRFAGLIKKHYQTLYYRANHPKPLDMVTFKDREMSGITAGELRTLFTERFYKIIARAGQNNKKQDLMYYLALYTSALVSFIAYEMYRVNGFK